MKSKLLSILVLSLCLQICESTLAKALSPATVVAPGDERTVKNFNGVVAGGPIQVIVTLGDKETLRFEGDAGAISTLVSEVRGELLIIRPQTSWISWSRKYEGKKITAYVTARQLSSISMSGDGSIRVIGTVTAAEFAATLSGSGSIKAYVEADKITGVLSGSGTSDISGKTGLATITLSGTGTFGSKALSADEVSARISGKGNIRISTNGKIKATISGSGQIYYSGDADIEQTVIGTGGVTKS